MKPWTRNDTKDWIHRLENRIEDIEYYLKKTFQWCEENDVYEERIVLACAVMTAAWVSYLRDEPLSKQEIFEILGMDGWEHTDDGIFEFNSDYDHLEHEELLQMIVSSI